MAGRSRRSSTELEPDLSTPSAPKKTKRSETSSEKLSAEEQPTEVESTEPTSSTGEVSSQQTEVLLVKGHQEQTSDVPERTKTPEQSVLIGEASSTKQLTQTSRELSERQGDTATEAIPSTSKEESLGTLKAIIMKYSEQGELSGPSQKRSECETTVQSFFLREHGSYEDLFLIGNGAYGTVYRAKDKTSGQIVALKKVRVPLTEDGLPMSTLREIAALKALERYEHPHIVKLLDVCQGDYLHLPTGDEQSERSDRGLTLWLVFEHVERDLASFVVHYRSGSPRSSIPSHLVRQMSMDILCGVEFLHSHRIIHRDLKPQNLLVTKEGRIKIADFGLAKTYDFEMRLTSVVVTQWYRAPEVLLGCSYATPVDIWSVGCIFAELCKLEPLFPGTSEGDQLDRIFQVLGTPSQQAWPENVSLSWTAFPHRLPKPLGAIIPDLNEHGLDLLKNMLMFDPHSRITAAQAVRHRYFSEESV